MVRLWSGVCDSVGLPTWLRSSRALCMVGSMRGIRLSIRKFPMSSAISAGNISQAILLIPFLVAEMRASACFGSSPPRVTESNISVKGCCKLLTRSVAASRGLLGTFERSTPLEARNEITWLILSCMRGHILLARRLASIDTLRSTCSRPCLSRYLLKPNEANCVSMRSESSEGSMVATRRGIG